MDIGSYGQLPGIGSLNQTSEKAITWGRDADLLYFNSALLKSTAIDAGATPTTTLRAGLVLGRKTSDKLLYALDPDAADGTENYAGVLLRDISMLDAAGVVEDKYAHVLRRGPVKAADILVQGTVLTSSVDEMLVRRMMLAAGCEFDDDVMGQLGRLDPVQNLLDSTTARVVTKADSGKRIFFSNAAAVLVTLPTIGAGHIYEFVRTGDEEIVVASAEGDNMIVGNDLSADSITFTTAGNHIGAIIRVEGVYVGTTLKWLVTLPPAPFGTGTATLAYAIAT